jgi:hypothetical protein
MEREMQRPRSQFVRDKIAGLTFTRPNRAYIDKLLQIERLVVDGVRSWITGMLSTSLRASYPVEYDAIHRELRLEEYERASHAEARRERALRAEARRHALAERQRTARERRLWVELGGTV